jgi:cell wall-active antibiotic response 4TMS protein YvqF/B-box zinc finger protein
MNCVNHPDIAAAAYCQNCGKPLCTGCMRSVGGVIYCEPCLAARLSSPPQGGNPYPDATLTALHAHPVLAGLLGFIPGVGAMYNGQYIKALAHVLIFAVFVSLSDKSFVFALLLAAWIFYQVFDAAQTAKARRDGLPLPNPFGLNDLGTKLGMAPTPAAGPYVAGFSPGPAAGGPAANPDPVTGQYPPSGPSQGFVQPPPYTASYGAPPPPSSGAPFGSAGSSSGPGTYNPPVYGPPGTLEPAEHKHPVGAVVLIIIGIVLLLQTLGVFEEEWISRAWPVAIIGVGAWLLYRRTRDTPRGGSQ